jgi:predicted RND superfamily exporter protein
MPTEDLFISRNLTELEEWLEARLSEYGKFAITGEAVLSRHLSSLIKRSMLRAYAFMIIALIVALSVMFRRIRYVVAPVIVLLVATLSTLGILALCGFAVNVFSITVFPLLVGIGIDDCIYIADARSRGARLRSASPLIKALALTTLTTVAGYSSLMAAAHRGFIDMGITAALGLVLVFLCTLFLLPPILGGQRQAPGITAQSYRKKNETIL